MNQLKYIVFEGNELNYDHNKEPVRKEMAIVFPQEITHRNAERSLLTKEVMPHVLAAGFLRWTGMRFVCDGHSETLDLKSRGELDAAVINKMLGVE